MKDSEVDSSVASRPRHIAPRAKQILVYGLTDTPGGIDNVILGYISHFDLDKVRFDFLCNTETMAQSAIVRQIGSKIYYVCNKRKNPIRHEQELKKFFRDHGSEYDVFWVNISSLSNISMLKYAKKYGIKRIIVHSHATYEDSKIRRLLHHINKPKLAKYATDFWACSDRAGEWLYTTEIRSSRNYRVIHNAIDVSAYKFNQNARKSYRKKYHIAGNETVFVNIGRLSYEKNQAFAVRLFSEYYKQVKSGWLFLVGDGPDRDMLKESAERLGVAERVKFLGMRDDIPQLLSMSDIFLFPSRREGLPLALLEAQASGLMCIVLDGAISPSAFVIPKNILEIAASDAGIIEAIRSVKELSTNYNRTIDIKSFQEAHYDIDTEAKIVMDELRQ